MKLTIELQIPNSFVPGQEITMQIDTEKYQVHHINTQMNQPFDKRETCISFQGFMQEIIKEKIINENLRTAEAYQSALNSLNKFTMGQTIPVSQIDGGFMERYETFLKKQMVCMNTVSFYMRILKAVYKRAVWQKMTVDNSPFCNVYTGVAKTRKRALDISLIKQIRSLTLNDEDERLARDLFLFSFYTRGMSFVDMAYLKKNDIKNGVLKYVRRKTGRTITVKWEQPMQEIVNNHQSYNNIYLLPIIKREGRNERSQYRYVQYKVNNNLSALGERLALPSKLTMYVARHSWASIAKSADVPLSVICEAMGHSSEKMTYIYLKSLDDYKIDLENERIINLLQD